MALEFTKEDGMIWQPVFTLPRNEKKLFASLSADGIAAYLPMRRITSVHPVVKGEKLLLQTRIPCSHVSGLSLCQNVSRIAQ